VARVGIVDYDAGNLKSVETAFEYLHADYVISSEPEVLEKTDKLIFPGVGEARAAMERLKHCGLDDFIRGYYRSGRNILGICLGAQIVLSRSEEKDTQCLALIPGTARRFPGGEGLKVPHMGWNSVEVDTESQLFEGIPNGSSFYFVHSYYPDPEERKCRLAVTEYGIEFCSALRKGGLHAIQFHPEKSGKRGLQLLRNYLTKIGPDCTIGGE
jgi:glutamine amidotransferase